ncbi:MAG TPA: ATP-grasp fold amidoligase family protein [Bacilli bacterium]|nr:ATP-grasp fold amidoligase family protein [Bacilli bacterium]
MNSKFRKLKPFQKALFEPVRALMRTVFPVTLVRWQYRYLTRHRLNLKHPVRYTEKLQYLRLYVYPFDQLAIHCSDRIGVRDYLSDLGLSRYLIPSEGVYQRFDDIDFASLPSSFVIKCSHACAYNTIVIYKNQLDVPTTKKQFDKWLQTDYGKLTIERHYSPIKPRILIERFLGTAQELPIEYKIHVFNGKAKSLYVVTGRGKDIRYTNFYIDWTRFDGSQFNGWKSADQPIQKPENFDEMVALAERVAAPFPFVRVDLYCIDGKIFFSEMTFTPAKGTLLLDDDKVDYEMGAWLDISHFL